MSTRKLLSTTHSHQIPLFVRNSIQLVQSCTNPPFIPKCPTFLATNLIKSYFEKGLIGEARTLFDEMPERDLVAWTAMIAGYTSCSNHSRAWMVFREMMNEELEPNAYTISSVLKACKGMKCISYGRLVHGLAVKHGLDGFIYVDNALMDMYAACSVSMHDACMVFRGIHVKNEVSWTTLIAGYTHRDNGYGALHVFRQMLMEEVELNPFTFSIAVRACTSIVSHTFGEQLHAAVIKHGFESNLPVMNSILDMYCRCSCFSEADRYFYEMHQRDLITWNTLIAGYERSDPTESLCIFSMMESEGFNPNCFTFTSILAACATLAFLNCGQQIHGRIIRIGLDGNLALSNALIDMYSKCGNIADSRQAFWGMIHRDLVSWTSMMIGYGTHGYGEEAIELFDEMVRLGIRPDRVVFMAVLSACSHAGLVDEGLRYFKVMVDDYNISPDQEIYGCVVDLLGRAGRVKEAYELIESMPFKPDETVWGPFLGACKVHRFRNLGKLATLKILDLRPNMAGTYVMLSNIYAADGKWGEFARLRKLMKRTGSKKETGRSWVEVGNLIYSFVVGDEVGSSMIEEVYQVLEILIDHMKEAGYGPDLDYLIYDLEDDT